MSEDEKKDFLKFFSFLNTSKNAPISKIISSYIEKMEEAEREEEFEPFPEGELKDVLSFAPKKFDEYLKSELKRNERLEDFLPNEIIAKIFYFRGRRELSLKNFFTAGKNFQEAINKNDGIPKYHYFLGISLFGGKKFSLSEQAFKKAIELDKKNPYFWHYLGITYYRGGAIKKALHMFKTALEIERKFSKTREFLKKEEIKIGEPILDQIKDFFSSFMKKLK